MIKIKDLKKSFIQNDGSVLVVLDGVNLEVSKGDFIAITGASGSGKSTLLHLLGGLDKTDKGEILFNNENIFNYNVKKMSFYRNQVVGFVYQFHYLLPELNVIENVSMPFLLNKFNKQEVFEKAIGLLDKIGLKDKALSFPDQLSGGERQRVAILRSLINNPELLLADEPTGNLDIKTGENVFLLFKDLIREFNLTAIIVTHNEHLARFTNKIYRIASGKLQVF